MDKQKALEQIKENLKKLLSFAKETKKFDNLTLTDGTNITIEEGELAVGVTVYQVDDQGNQTPLEDGDYVLQDGRTFTIKSNVVEVVSGPEEDPEAVQSGEKEVDSVETAKQKLESNLPVGHDGKQDQADQPTQDTQKEGDISSRVEDLEKQVADILTLLQQISGSQTEVNETMMGAVNFFKTELKKFGAEPGDKPIKLNKKGYEEYKSVTSKRDENSEDLLKRMRSISKEMRQYSNNRLI